MTLNFTIHQTDMFLYMYAISLQSKIGKSVFKLLALENWTKIFTAPPYDQFDCIFRESMKFSVQKCIRSGI